MQIKDARRRTGRAPVQIFKLNGRVNANKRTSQVFPLSHGWETDAVWLEGRAIECKAPTEVLAIAYREVYWQSDWQSDWPAVTMSRWSDIVRKGFPFVGIARRFAVRLERGKQHDRVNR